MSESKYGDTFFTFHWVIKNFSFIRPDLEHPLCSPYFNVNAYGIAYIQLYPIGDVFNEDCLLLDIKLPNKFQHVPVDCELSCYDLKGISVQFSKEKITDRQGWKFKKISESTRQNNELVSFKFQPEIENEYLDVLIVQLSFFNHKISIDDNNSTTVEFGIFDVENVSRDFSKLFKYPEFSDVTLCAGGETFSVHKAILWARAPKFANEIGLQCHGESPRNIKVTYIDPVVLKSFLSYLYSGKLDMDIVGLPLDLYTLAETYDIVDLKRKLYIFPCETFASTCIKVDEKTFIWDINILTLLDEKVYSPVFRAGSVPWSEFQLMFSFSKNSAGIEDVEVRVRRIFPEKEKSILLYCKLCIMGADGDTPFTCEGRHYFQKDEEWLLPHFVCKENLFSRLNLPDDIFHVKCDLFVSGEEASELERTRCSSVSTSSRILNARDVTSLSCDFKLLYNSTKFSDVILKIGEMEYSAHKAILCARSLVFSRMFSQDMSESKSGFVEITDIEPAILNTLLLYAYSGIVAELNYEVAIKLYCASDKYEFLSLKNACTYFLNTKVEVENACELLLLSDSHSDAWLKMCMIEFICANAEHVLALDDWKDLITFRVSLGSEVLRKLTEIILSKIEIFNEGKQVGQQ